MKLKMYLIGLGMGVIVTAIIMGIALSGRTKDMTDEEIIARARQLGMVESSRLSEVTDSGEGTYLLAQGQTTDTTTQNAQILSPADTGNPSSLVITGEDDEEGNGETDTAGGANSGASGGAGDSAAEAEDGASAGSGASSSAREDSAQGSQSGESTSSTAGSSSGAQESTRQGAALAQGSSTQNGVSTESSGASASQASSQEVQATGSIVVTIPDASSSEEICVLLETAGVIDNATAFNNYLVQNGRDRYISTGAKLIPRGSSYEDVSRIITGR